MNEASGFFVAGTDPGVGKTVVACGLLRSLRARGIDVVGMKPIETGVGSRGPADAHALQSAADSDDRLDDIGPLRFGLAAEPDVAAAAERRPVDADLLRDAFTRLAARHAAVLVEGSGGLLTRLAPGLDSVDLAARWKLPVLLVTRGERGALARLRLGLEALGARGLDVVGVAISHASEPALDPELDALRESLGVDLVGEVPRLAGDELAGPEHFRLAPLIERLR